VVDLLTNITKRFDALLVKKQIVIVPPELIISQLAETNVQLLYYG